MKRIFCIVLAALALGFSATAQHNFRTGYFLDGYAYKHKLNPAFGNDRGYFAIPVAGFATAGVESNLSLSTLLYPTEDGGFTTFLSPTVSAADFMSKIQNDNPLNINADLSVFSLGFNAGKSFNTIDLSLKADARASVPGALFSWAKQYGNHLDLSSLNVNANARLELSYGYSRSIGEKVRFGFKLKFLAGLARAEYNMDDFILDVNGDKLLANVHGTGHFTAPGMTLMTEDGIVNALNIPDYTTIIDAALASRNLGGAIDLGISVDLLKWLTVSASVTDLGFINWTGTGLSSNVNSVEYAASDFYVDPDGDALAQLKSLGEELVDMASMRVTGEEKLLEDLSMTTHVGIELRMPFWQRLSVGALGTYRFDGPHSWWEARGSVNLALFRWFSLSGNYAYSTYGESYGAAINFHPKGINLFVGVDSFAPALNMTPQYIPDASLNTNVAVGLNIAFGKYHGRFPRKK